ncbi:zinc finger CCHC domain-containing protein 7-like [Ornithodoros turicata]|uniref:zinc finger CCHC domain-containing protein 7-like n=1 Tax=Ornithodoros turicata TaxID=34597 RepID=UPI003139838E
MPRNSPQHGPFCFNCAGEGHFGHRCPFKRRGFFSTPFIVSYAIPRWDERVDEDYGPHRKKRKPERWQNHSYNVSAETAWNEPAGRRRKKKKKGPKGTQNGEADRTIATHKNCKLLLKQKKKKEATMKRKQKRREKQQAAKATRKVEERKAKVTKKNTSKKGNSTKKRPGVVHLQSAS